MIDYSALEWYVTLDVDDMTVSDLGELIKAIQSIEDVLGYPEYELGMDESEKGIQLCYDNGSMKLYLNQIADSHMAEVLDILTEFDRIRVEEIFHECLSRRFCKKFDLRGVQMLDVYRDVLKQNKYEKRLVWEYWKSESGFNDFCKEVYEDD